MGLRLPKPVVCGWASPGPLGPELRIPHLTRAAQAQPARHGSGSGWHHLQGERDRVPAIKVFKSTCRCVLRLITAPGLHCCALNREGGVCVCVCAWPESAFAVTPGSAGEGSGSPTLRLPDSGAPSAEWSQRVEQEQTKETGLVQGQVREPAPPVPVSKPHSRGATGSRALGEVGAHFLQMKGWTGSLLLSFLPRTWVFRLSLPVHQTGGQLHREVRRGASFQRGHLHV